MAIAKISQSSLISELGPVSFSGDRDIKGFEEWEDENINGNE